jgi:hypothetical protein
MMGKLIGGGVSFIIVIINLILKIVIIASITWVGEDTNSEQLSSITNGVFAAQFFNTGILLVLVNANLSEHDPLFVTKYIKGPFYDYMPIWYAEVGENLFKLCLSKLLCHTSPFVQDLLFHG